MLDHLGRHQRSEPRSPAIFHAARQSDQKPGGEQIPRTGGVDQRELHPVVRGSRLRPSSSRAMTVSIPSRCHNASRTSVCNRDAWL